MARNTRTRRRRSPVQDDQSSDDSQNSRRRNHQTAPSRSTGRVRHTRRDANTGEEFDITLTDERSSGPSQQNSQVAPPRPQASNSGPPRAATASQAGSQRTSQDIKHYFRKTSGSPTICTSCE